DIRPRDRKPLLRFAWRVMRARSFDLGLATFFSSTFLASMVLMLTRCRYRVAFAETRPRGFLNTLTLLDRGGHELERHLRLLEYTGRPLEPRTALFMSSNSVEHAAEFLAPRGLGVERPLLGVHPGCDRQNMLKRWPIERFVSVITQVVNEGLAD